MSAEEADEAIVAKFEAEGEGLTDGAVPIASLSVLWYLDSDGQDHVVWKLDGRQRVSVTVGDLMALVHSYLHDER